MYVWNEIKLINNKTNKMKEKKINNFDYKSYLDLKFIPN